MTSPEGAPSPGPGPAPPPRAPRWRRRALVAATALALLAGAGGAASGPVVDALCARWDREVEAELAALAADGHPIEVEAAAAAAAAVASGRGATPALERILEALRLSEAEIEALQLEARWRLHPERWLEPGQPPPPASPGDGPEAGRPQEPRRYEAARHRELIAALLARLDQRTPELDRALAPGAWPSIPVLWTRGPPDDAPPPFREAQRLLDLRGEVRGGPDRWRDLARWARIAALWDDPSWTGVHLRDDTVFHLVFRLRLLLASTPIDPEGAARLDEGLAALDRPDAIAVALRHHLAAALVRLRPDEPSMTEVDLRLGPWHPFRKAGPLRRAVVYHLDRLRWVRLQARAIRAVSSRPPADVLAEVEELQAEVAHLAGRNSPVTCGLVVPPPVWIDRQVRALARLRMARMALALAQSAARDGSLPDRPPLALVDPFADPPRALSWRVTGSRTGLLSSVGLDGEDDGGVEESPRGDGVVRGDLLLAVALPPE